MRRYLGMIVLVLACFCAGWSGEKVARIEADLLIAKKGLLLRNTTKIEVQTISGEFVYISPTDLYQAVQAHKSDRFKKSSS